MSHSDARDEASKGDAPRPGRFGPFHRLESDTQTAEDAVLQTGSGEIHGGIPFGSGWPQVQAYRGSLPSGARGIEFYTDLPPDQASPRSEVRWSGAGRRRDVATVEDVAIIPCVITRNTQATVE